jgi:DNA-directed RNA polymerase subunit K/omega
MESIITTNRTNTIVVDKKNRITSNILTKYEYVNIINTRIDQIANDITNNKNCKLFIDIRELDKNQLHNPIYIANQEFLKQKIPFIIARKIGDSKIEYWSLIDDNMIYIDN